MIEKQLPVLILGYMRFTAVKRLLITCKNAGVSRIYLALDGAKDQVSYDFQEDALKELCDYAKVNELTLLVRRRHSNAGLAVAVIEGISWFFQFEEFGVILEDDLEVSPSFFTFVCSAFEQYQGNQNIAVISGNNYFAHHSNASVNATHYPLIWGWATWRNQWDEFLLAIHNPSGLHFIQNTSIQVNCFWLTASLQSRLGIVDSWAMSFAHFLRVREKICVLSPQNLVTNFGADSHAVHSRHEDDFINFPKQEIENEIVWTLPSKDAVSCYDMRLESFVFQISARNILSPIKLIIGLLRKRGRVSLKSRLKLSEAKADFLIFKGGR